MIFVVTFLLKKTYIHTFIAAYEKTNFSKLRILKKPVFASEGVQVFRTSVERMA